ncbi:MAG: SDR family oxidoreductase [Anaerolinea sp.]|nr:SDR family oxidoreductase [Anaerolinea sp.]
MSGRNYQGATVFVTGAAGGLGRALCQRFAAAGANVAALDRDAATLNLLAADLTAAGVRCLALPCDVTDEAACAAAIGQAAGHFGRIDVLVNNAGISHRSALFDTAPDVIRRVMAVNFFGALHATHAALPALLAARGQVIAISSVAGFAPLMGRAGYAASKHALHGFFDSLRTEVEDAGVGVLLVCPSFIDTGIDRAALGADGRPLNAARQTAGRVTTPDEVADAVFRAAAGNRRALRFSATAKAAWWLTRLWPQRYAAIMKRRFQGEYPTRASPATMP